MAAVKTHTADFVGSLDRRIRFQKDLAALDENGGLPNDWQDIEESPEVWAKFEPMAGSEVFVSMGILADADARFTVRYRSDLSVMYRIVFDGEAYDVKDMREMGRREYLSIVAKRVAA